MAKPNPKSPAPADPDDPDEDVDPTDPNLSFTEPPNPANMRLPEGASADWTWHVLTGAEAVGMSSSWHITSALTNGVSGQVHAAYPSWQQALEAYTMAYNANAVRVLRRDGRPSRRLRRRGATPTPQPAPTATPGGSRSNPYVIGSSAPTTPHRPSAQGAPSGTSGNPHLVAASSPRTPFPSGHPQHPFFIGSSPAPATPEPRAQSAAPSSAARLRVIQEALSEGRPYPPPPALDRDSIRARLRALNDALDQYDRGDRRGSHNASPQTPTQAHSNIESRLSNLEAAMERVLAREAERDSLETLQRELRLRAARTALQARQAQDGRDLILNSYTSSPSHTTRSILDGRDPTPPRSAPPATPIAGSSTGPGTMAGSAAHSNTGNTALRSPFALGPAAALLEDDEYDWDDEYTAEENAEIDALLNAIHDNYKLNKK